MGRFEDRRCVPTAEGEGFDPSVPCGTHAFQACALDHYANPPDALVIPERNPCGQGLKILLGCIAMLHGIAKFGSALSEATSLRDKFRAKFLFKLFSLARSEPANGRKKYVDPKHKSERGDEI